jgi:hypothetical protein
MIFGFLDRVLVVFDQQVHATTLTVGGLQYRFDTWMCRRDQHASAAGTRSKCTRRVRRFQNAART